MSRRVLMVSTRRRKEIKERQERELNELKRQHAEALGAPVKMYIRGDYKPEKLTGRAAERDRTPSLTTSICSTGKVEIPRYTGTRLLGIAVLHKSCLQPIFSQEEAIAAATMRRN